MVCHWQSPDIGRKKGDPGVSFVLGPLPARQRAGAIALQRVNKAAQLVRTAGVLELAQGLGFDLTDTLDRKSVV